MSYNWKIKYFNGYENSEFAANYEELSRFHTPKIHRITISTNSQKGKTMVTIKETRKKIYIKDISNSDWSWRVWMYPVFVSQIIAWSDNKNLTEIFSLDVLFKREKKQVRT